MNRKHLLLIPLGIVLLVVLFYISRSWFAPEILEIGTTIRPNHLSPELQRGLGPAVAGRPYTVSFFFNRELILESAKVVRAQEVETNRFASPLWELVPDGDVIPVRSLTYGVPVRGMKPAVAGAPAEPLRPGVAYRLLLRTSQREASHDFILGGK